MSRFGKAIRVLFGREGAESTPSQPAAQKEESLVRQGYGYEELLQFFAGTSPLSISTVYRCAGVIADSVASLPLRYMKRNGSGVYEADERDRMNYLLTVRPNPGMSAYDLWNNAIYQVLLAGNAYIVPVWSNVKPDELDYLFLCSRGTVSHDIVNNTYEVYDPLQGISGTYNEEDIIHIKNVSLDGKNGLSVVSFAQQTLGIASAGDAETLNRFANGGNVRGIVSNDTSVRGFGEYQDTELQKTAKDLDTRFRTGERIISLPGQAQFSPLSMTSAEMQFLESRKFTVREICRWFGVPPSFVFDDTSNNYKSAEMANVAFLSQTLNPLLYKIERELQGKLVPEFRSPRYRFQFDRRELYATDLESRANYQTKTIAAGIYTINEWRRYENKPDVEGGDTPLVSANLKTISELKSQQAQPAGETTNTVSDE